MPRPPALIPIRPIAHAAQNPDGTWRSPHDLAEHLYEVAKMAARFADSYGPHWAQLAGQWHDLGKYRPRFQNYIRQVTGFEIDFEPDAHIKGEATGKAPHSTAGALWACQQLDLAGRVLAYVIAGHHAGLSDWQNRENFCLQTRLAESKSTAELQEALAANPPAQVLMRPEHIAFDLSKQVPGGSDGFALWVRMLFSALVDADFLDTERYMNPDRFEKRNRWSTLHELAPLFDAYIENLTAQADPSSKVNQIRAHILAECREKAAQAPGIFSLDVPTGGGKTLSSMAFALTHAKRYEKRRVIYVIPYTSIIEQTADVFRGIFGEAVLEHHSNAEVSSKAENQASRLACENWDAPIIVTTNVQFFESLFAARTSRCRKLHNLVNSVVVLDEAQLLPPEFLKPILHVLNLLSTHYGVTVVISTATQPVLSSRQYFDPKQNIKGLDRVQPIISDPDALHQQLTRVEVRLPTDLNVPITWPALADELIQHDSVLVVVNTRRDARDLWQLLPEGTIHLSALMCGAHRSHVIHTIKERLKAGLPTRVVSTQLVECGVDVDFPVVYRALAGLDSIAQAAGRCNREGKLKDGQKGLVVVFVPPTPAPKGQISAGVAACKGVLRRSPDAPLSRAAFQQYFSHFYVKNTLDAKDIMGLLSVNQELGVSFKSAADAFKLIADEDTRPVVVRYGPDGRDVEKWVGLLKKPKTDGSSRGLMRKLQRYIVNVPKKQVLRLQQQGDIEEVLPDGLWVAVSDWLYDPDVGLLPEGTPLNPMQWVY